VKMEELRFFLSRTELELLGANISETLNVLMQKNIPFRDMNQIDAQRCRIRVCSQHIEEIQKLALSCYCQVRVIGRSGIWEIFKKLLKRPCLLIGCAAAIFMSFYLQTFVLMMDVSGNEKLHEQQILRALQEVDIQFGSRGAQIDPQLTKHRMLSKLPQLSWIGVNRSGCKLNILVTERTVFHDEKEKIPAANIIASRDATLSELIVSEGMKLCKVGDSVKKGQILVSGFEDYGLFLKAVCAEAEIYGQTWYSGMLATPLKTRRKCYTGRSWKEYSLIIGRKRINLCTNSSFLGMTCDKIVSVKELRLQNFAIPIRLEEVTCREYTLYEELTDTQQRRKELEFAWKELVRSQMLAGKILSTQCSFSVTDELLILCASSTCNEMIARRMPMEPLFKGDSYE